MTIQAIYLYPWRAAAGLGLAAALLMSGPTAVRAGSFEDGHAAYQRTDFLSALKIWKPLAENGDERAQYNLGIMYDEGRGVSADKAVAAEWWLKAAKQDMPEALHNLASSYLFGAGFAADPSHDEAVAWMARAAELGLPRSQYTLGKMYLAAHGVGKDEAAGRRWIEKAARQGLDKAQYNMGKLSRDGVAGAVDKKAAAQWFLKAARQGYAKAQNHIAKRYAKGEGIDKNVPEALFWYTLAAGQGHTAAESKRQGLLNKMSPADVDAVIKRIEAWKPEKP